MNVNKTQNTLIFIILFSGILNSLTFPFNHIERANAAEIGNSTLDSSVDNPPVVDNPTSDSPGEGSVDVESGVDDDTPNSPVSVK